jgi:hypothetical protein
VSSAEVICTASPLSGPLSCSLGTPALLDDIIQGGGSVVIIYDYAQAWPAPRGIFLPASIIITLYNSELKCFGLRAMPPSGRNPSGAKTWIVEYRPGAGGRSVAKKRHSLELTTTLTPERAREAAKTLLAQVCLGSDPRALRHAERSAQTIRALRMSYSEETNAVRKPRTVELYESY